MMSTDSAPEGTVAIVSVPEAHAAQVRDFATSLMEEQSPEVEGYAALIKGVGDIGGVRPDPAIGGGIGISAISGTNCSITRLKKDFDCADDDND